MTKQVTANDLVKIEENIYEIAQSFRSDMRVPARVYAHETMIEDILGDRSLEQLVNVATLPGIQKYALAMPDIHQGYGFPIGGVAALAIKEGGVISPGGIGYDINCGIRLLAANVTEADIKDKIPKLASEFSRAIPSGVGRGGRLKFNEDEINQILLHGARYMLEKGFGVEDDLEFCEERASMAGADPDHVSDRAKKRGADQVGTLGAGNHFLEIQKVDEIYDKEAAQLFGLEPGTITVMIHCGSRGLGHQVCTDHVKIMMSKVEEWGITLPDRELVCAPFDKPEAKNYFAAMVAASNFAWANRHTIAHWVRREFQEVLGQDAQLSTVYDVSHNIGKIEKHFIDGRDVEVIMHRKGATRSFGPGRSEIPSKYQSVGQPVLIPGTMGTSSYVLVGTDEAMNASFGSTCHGAGRLMSRSQAKKTVRGSELRKELEARGIIIRAQSDAGLAEEAPLAYKDVDNVVEVVHETGIARRVARVLPLAVIKG